MTWHVACLAAMLAFCGVATAAEPATQTAQSTPATQGAGPKKIAILANVWSANCHANVIATKFFTGFPIDTGLAAPQVQVASVWIAQPSDDDVGHKLAEKAGVKVYPTITEALTLGGKKLAVDGVVYIGQHGTFQPSRFNQRMYPHLSHLEEVFRVFDTSDRSVPVYNDKELAYGWLDAKWIYDRARELKAPLMAGSVIPLTYRRPMVVHPIGTEIKEAVAIGYGGLDAYAFHALEVLQCMLERRKGGETGVSSVTYVAGPAVYEAAKEGKFSMELAEAACAQAGGKKPGTMADHETGPNAPVAVLVSYRDGTKGTVIIATRYVGEFWGYAAKAGDQTVACEFVAPPKPIYSYFSYLGLNIEKMIQTGKPQTPVERTLMTTGILDAAVRSRANQGKTAQTPYLNIKYKPLSLDPIWPAASEPSGASVGPWPPTGFEFIMEQAKASPRQKKAK